MSLVLCLAM